jgi:hypothetical protein
MPVRELPPIEINGKKYIKGGTDTKETKEIRADDTSWDVSHSIPRGEDILALGFTIRNIRRLLFNAQLTNFEPQLN